MPADWFVFCDLRGDPSGQTPRRPGWLSLAWKRYRARHGAQGVRLHDLRHWHATSLMSAGVPIATTSKRLGHAKISTTTDIYVAAVDKDDVRAAKTIGRKLALPAPK